MTTPLIFFEEAKEDIQQIFVAYEKESPGLGARFIERLEECTDNLQLFPELYGRVHKDIRAAPLKRFPHVVYHRYRAGVVQIVAVVHGSRLDTVWKSRL